MNVQMEVYRHWDRTLETALVVDDDPDDRAALCAALKGQRPDMQIVEFDTVAAARRFALEARPDMIFLDHRLPDGWGGALAAELVQMEAFAEVPLFVVTDEPLETVDHRVIAMSKDDVSRDSIAALISEYLRARRDAGRRSAAELAMALAPEGVRGCLSAAVRDLRSARAQVARSAPLDAVRRLELAEDRVVAALARLEAGAGG